MSLLANGASPARVRPFLAHLMKYTLTLVIACLLFSSPCAQAEDLIAFLKRSAAGKFTADDFHDNFIGVVLTPEKAIEINKEKMEEVLQAIETGSLKIAVDSFEIVSKTETPLAEEKSTIISVVTKVKTTTKSGDTVTKAETISHDTLVRLPDGKFVYLFSAAKH